MLRMLRDSFKIWKMFSFETMLDEFERRQKSLFGEIFNSDIIQKFRQSEFFILVKDRIINGTSVEGLKRYEGEELNDYVTITREFRNSVSISHKYAPVIYCLSIMKGLIDAENDLKKKNKWLEQYWRFSGRAYRSFAPFIRDYDSKERIEYFLIFKNLEEDIDIKVSQNPFIDSKRHTDILFTFKDKRKKLEFKIWLYQSSNPGLEKLIDRLRGKRGVIENGYHVLAPIDIDKVDDKVEDWFHWILYSDRYLKNIVSICREIFDEKYLKIVFYKELKKEMDD